MKKPAILSLLFLFASHATGIAEKLARPKVLQTEDLRDFQSLPKAARNRISTALSVARKNDWLRYQFGSADPANKGFDCSGAMNYVLASLKYQIPRTSSNQYLWLRKNDALRPVPASVESLDDKVFEKLRPGDLVFWAGTYKPRDGRKTKVTHVGMYLGQEKKDGRPVMICSSKGRSYRGVAADGYGVFDFRVPRKTSKSKIVAYGTPPAPDE